MSIPSQVTHNLKCPPELSSLLISHLNSCTTPNVCQNCHPSRCTTPNVCHKISPSILISWSQFMVHLHRVVLPDHYSRTVLSLLVCLVQDILPCLVCLIQAYLLSHSIGHARKPCMHGNQPLSRSTYGSALD